MISINVYGIPKPAGSKRAMHHNRTGRIILLDDSKGSRGWKTAVSKEAVAAMDGADPLDGPVELVLVFVMPRPKSHYGTGRNADVLKANAPARHTIAPDALKLARAVEDALSKIVYRDDAQIVHEIISKRYGDAPGVQIFVEPFDEESSQLRIEEVHE